MPATLVGRIVPTLKANNHPYVSGGFRIVLPHRIRSGTHAAWASGVDIRAGAEAARG